MLRVVKLCLLMVSATWAEHNTDNTCPIDKLMAIMPQMSAGCQSLMSGAVMGGALPTLQEVSVLHLTPFSQREGICSHAHELCAWIVGAGVPVLPRVR